MLVGVLDRRLHAGQRDARPSQGDARRPRGWTASTGSRSCRSARGPRRRRRPAGATGRRRAAPSPRRRGAAPPGRRARPVAASRWYMVGTPKNMVVARRPAASRIASSSKRSNSATEAPAASVPKRPAHEAVHVEERQAEDETVVGLQPQADSSAETPARSERVRVHGALRCPGGARGVDDQRVVVGSSGKRIPTAAAGPSRRGRARRTRRPAARSPGPNALGARRSHTATPGRASRDTWATSARRRRGADGTSDRAGAQHGEEDLRRTRAWPGRTTAHGRPGRRRGQRARPPSPPCVRRALRRRSPAPGRHPSTQHGASGGPPSAAAHTSGSVRPGRGGGAIRPAPGGNERPHRRRPQVIVWRS